MTQPKMKIRHEKMKLSKKYPVIFKKSMEPIEKLNKVDNPQNDPPCCFFLTKVSVLIIK